MVSPMFILPLSGFSMALQNIYECRFANTVLSDYSYTFAFFKTVIKAF